MDAVWELLSLQRQNEVSFQQRSRFLSYDIEERNELAKQLLADDASLLRGQRESTLYAEKATYWRSAAERLRMGIQAFSNPFGAAASACGLLSEMGGAIEWATGSSSFASGVTTTAYYASYGLMAASMLSPSNLAAQGVVQGVVRAASFTLSATEMFSHGIAAWNQQSSMKKGADLQSNDRQRFALAEQNGCQLKAIQDELLCTQTNLRALHRIINETGNLSL